MAVLVFGALLFAAGVLAFTVMLAAVASIFGAVIWLVLLPFRLLSFVLHLVFLAVAGGLGLAILAVTCVIVGVALCLAFLAPLLPFAIVGGLVWLVMRSRRAPARVAN